MQYNSRIKSVYVRQAIYEHPKMWRRNEYLTAAIIELMIEEQTGCLERGQPNKPRNINNHYTC